jgi:magnesium-transporting ATPase (P-type)
MADSKFLILFFLRHARHEVEREVDFLGFIVFENRLKPDTKGVIKSLTDADFRSVMVTGDNILTAVCVARDAGIIAEAAKVFHPATPALGIFFFLLFVSFWGAFLQRDEDEERCGFV